MNPFTFAPVSLFFSLSLLTGVSVHDTKIDKLTTAIASTANYSGETGTKSIATDAHTHVERVNWNAMKSHSPRILPSDHRKKHMMQKNAAKGHHPFDNYSLPLVD